jgi:hypothetical protein
MRSCFRNSFAQGGIGTKLCTYQVKIFQKTRPEHITLGHRFHQFRLRRLIGDCQEDPDSLAPTWAGARAPSARPVIPDDNTLVGAFLRYKAHFQLELYRYQLWALLALSGASSLFLFALTL